jgi:flagellar motor switch protein FliG
VDTENTTQQNQGYYINGKQQAVELLQALDLSERKKLLKNMSARNAVMTRELSEQCFSFKDIAGLKNEELGKLLNITNPIITGLAISLTDKNFQKRALSSMDRSKAEQAFEIMTKDLSSKKNECLKAQQKIIETAILLSRKKIIQFH